MAITTLDGLVAAARQTVNFTKTASATTVALNPSTLLDLAGMPGAGSLSIGNTANGLVPTDATAGFPALDAFGGGNTGYIAALSFDGTVLGRYGLKDRLFHSGSHALTPTGSTNLSTQPSFLGRCPDGAGGGTEIWLEINTAVAASAVTVAVSYTNSAGTTGRTTGASVALTSYITRRLIRMPFQAGDVGVSKIEGYTIGGTAAATGSFNIIVARPLIEGMRIPVAGGGDKWSWDKTGLVQIYDTSALWPVAIPDSTSSGVVNMLMTVVNG